MYPSQWPGPFPDRVSPDEGLLRSTMNGSTLPRSIHRQHVGKQKCQHSHRTSPGTVSRDTYDATVTRETQHPQYPHLVLVRVAFSRVPGMPVSKHSRPSCSINHEIYSAEFPSLKEAGWQMLFEPAIELLSEFF